MGNIIQMSRLTGDVFPRTTVYNTKYTDADCRTAFVRKMNEKAAGIGMSNTTFINPTGLGESGNYSSTTVKDLARLGVVGLSYNDLCFVWSAGEHYVKRKGKTPTQIISSYQTNTTLTNYYPVIGGKTGAGDGYYTLVIATEIDGVSVVGAIAQASSDNGRFQAMKELFDVCKVVINGGTPSSNPVPSANCACALKVPIYNTASLGDTSLEVLYEKNASTVTPPMSTTKIMTSIVLLDYIKSLSACFKLTAYDFAGTPTGSYIFDVGDIATVEDIFYAMMLRSANEAANALGRFAGNVILQSEAFELL